ncbi:MAG TPA: hypothetical protein PKK06_12795 [Phycisphaerae bacterium]|nr:hypothetical protein [Phycisphaerae bacterium]HNU45513.1 hypothetical protein [Phycisphaerae bacterium]
MKTMWWGIKVCGALLLSSGLLYASAPPDANVADRVDLARAARPASTDNGTPGAGLDGLASEVAGQLGDAMQGSPLAGGDRGVFYDNGPLVTHPGGGCGGDISQLQTGLGLNIIGFGADIANGIHLADDFTLTESRVLGTATFFVYETGAPAPTITGVYVQIWDGPPNAGGSVIWGNMATNRLVPPVTFSGIYRSPPTIDCTRQIQVVVADLGGVILGPGTYWVEMSLTGSAVYTGPWVPPVTILGQTGKPGANALQWLSDHWAAVIDDGQAQAPQDLPFLISSGVAPTQRASTSEKGSLIVYPKVELRWQAGTGNLKQDTFIDLTNDYPASVAVQLYFVNGDPPAPAVYNGATLVERAHPGYNWVGNAIWLSNVNHQDEPAFWSAFTGQEKGVESFTVLDPPSGPFNPADPSTWPGRPADDGSGDRVLRGFVLAWAVNELAEEICWNHLSGDALLIDYLDTMAWEYNAWAFAALVDVPQGDPTGTPGELSLDGIEYEACPSMLLLDFYASGTHALSGGNNVDVTGDTDLTLLPMLIDERQDTLGPVLTKAKFDIWNQNEVKFSNTTRCLTLWDQQLLSLYGVPNHFLRQYLQTNKGKARIDGVASAAVCGPGSVSAPLLAVAAKVLTFVNQGVTDYETAGLTPVGMGYELGAILYDPDPNSIPPEAPAP